jgi:chemotaxis protein methyltransferase CheR
MLPTAPQALPELDAKLFSRFAKLVRERAGIALGQHKLDLVRGRLQKRLRALGLSTFEAYWDALERDPRESQWLVNAITTNKTSFFREDHHFDLLAAHLRGRGQGERVNIWSAACSSGEEVWSAAMTADATLGARTPYKLLATDVDTDVLARAERGIYPSAALEDIPAELARRYLLKGRGRANGTVQVKPGLRERATFATLNFVLPSWPLRARFEAIFCRNVLIYFDAEMQRRTVDRLLSFLVPGGIFFLGHSESLLGVRSDLRRIGPTAFIKHEGT